MIKPDTNSPLYYRTTHPKILFKVIDYVIDCSSEEPRTMVLYMGESNSKIAFVIDLDIFRKQFTPVNDQKILPESGTPGKS